ncbi:hypothetical protein I551_0813 [Mycobacterium ulcerans str. Harvey]|uniref:Uncharacterized protein n=1 Tax=Mycobacterium ulcerans str. Harvey TaxID=1299332 RepID=A0ABN0R6W5_MYCUL|nr:hypothetical protein I551_0813 [Mycobacterium ulcerans str. Harvey]
MRTAQYTVDALLYVDRLRSATALLASHGNPAGATNWPMPLST